MPRQLKTYVTASGFFELAVAAPSMKAALEIWGADPDLFRRGNAKETNDAAIVKATMAKPGAVLKRAAGGQGGFSEHANLPDVSTWKQPVRKRAVSKPAAAAPMAKPPKAKADKPKVVDRAAERKAAPQNEAARKKRAREAARAEAAERKAREHRKQFLEKAEAVLKAAQDAHDRRVATIEGERAALERRARDEAERWQDERRQLEAAVNKARA